VTGRGADRSWGTNLNNIGTTPFAYWALWSVDYRALFRIVVSAALALLLISKAVYSADLGSTNPIQFISGLYGQLVASGEAMTDPLSGGTDNTSGHGLLDPALVALSQRDGATHPNEPGIEISLCNCQEGPVTDVRVRVIAAATGRAAVEARFKVGGMPRIMRLLLVGDIVGKWQIMDLQNWTDPSHPWSVRRAMSLDVASSPGPVRPMDTVGRWAIHDCQRDWSDWHWDGQLLSFTAPDGHVYKERWVAALPDGFATETVNAPDARWEYHFTYQGVQARNLSAGRGFLAIPCE
jgi:hypothetical protein